MSYGLIINVENFSKSRVSLVLISFAAQEVQETNFIIMLGNSENSEKEWTNRVINV